MRQRGLREFTKFQVIIDSFCLLKTSQAINFDGRDGATEFRFDADLLKAQADMDHSIIRRNSNKVQGIAEPEVQAMNTHLETRNQLTIGSNIRTGGLRRDRPKRPHNRENMNIEWITGRNGHGGRLHMKRKSLNTVYQKENVKKITKKN